MAGFTYPSVLDSANWSKQKGVPPKSDVAKALDSLKKTHGNLDTSLLDTGKLKSVDDVKGRIDAVNAAVGKGVKTAADEAKNVSTTANDFKKGKETTKEAATAAGLVAKAADDYAKDVGAAFQSVLKELAPLLAKLEAASKKDEENEDEEDPDLEKDRKKVGKLIESAMKEAKKKPMKFVIGVFKKQVMAFVGKSTSSSTEKRLKKLMEVKEHVDFMRGTVTFEDNKAWVFEGVNIRAGGFAVMLQKALMEQTGKRYKVKTRRPTGETDETGDDGDEGADDALEQVSEKGGKEAAKAAEVLARHKKLKPLFDGLISAGGALAGEVRTGLASFESNVRSKKFDEALKVLDDLEKSLRAKAAQSGKGGDAAEGRAKETADAAIDKARGAAQAPGSAKLATEWASAAQDVRDGIKSLIEKIKQEYSNEPDQKVQVADAVKKLEELSSSLQDDLSTKLSEVFGETDPAKRADLTRKAKVAWANVAKMVAGDKLLRELDGNELLPSLKVVAPLKARLSDIGRALG
ncbi:MAG TPA: hypothetical protein VKI18_12705 [Albitalea sp.]|nr:hypothetical protein [Albitalea sp.]